jgi:hypothetical protein
MELFNLENEWNVLDFRIFFGGCGYMSDPARVVSKLVKAGAMPDQIVMVNGIQFRNDPKLYNSGEGNVGLRYNVAPVLVKEVIEKIYTTLLDFNVMSSEDRDQYDKINIVHRLDNGEWIDVDWRRGIDYGCKNYDTDILEALRRVA